MKKSKIQVLSYEPVNEQTEAAKTYLDNLLKLVETDIIPFRAVTDRNTGKDLNIVVKVSSKQNPDI